MSRVPLTTEGVFAIFPLGGDMAIVDEYGVRGEAERLLQQGFSPREIVAVLQKEGLISQLDESAERRLRKSIEGLKMTAWSRRANMADEKVQDSSAQEEEKEQGGSPSAQEEEKEQEEISKPQETYEDLLKKAEEVFRRLEGVLKETPEKVAQAVEEAPKRIAQAVEEKKEVLKEVIPPIVAKSLEEERKQVLSEVEKAKEEVKKTKEEVKTLCDKFPELCRIYIAEAIKEKLEEAGEKPEVKEDVHTMTEGFEKVPPSAYLDFLEKHVEECPSCKEVKDKIAQKLLEVGKKLGGVLPEEKEEALGEGEEKVIQFPKEEEYGEKRKASGWWFDY